MPSTASASRSTSSSASLAEGSGRACGRHRAVGRRWRRHARRQGDQGARRPDAGPGCRTVTGPRNPDMPRKRHRQRPGRHRRAGRRDGREAGRIRRAASTCSTRSGRRMATEPRESSWPSARRSTRSCAASPATISPATRPRPSCAASSAACRSRSWRSLEAYVERLRQRPDGGRAPVPRPADQRHQFLPRRRRLRGA